MWARTSSSCPLPQPSWALLRLRAALAAGVPTAAREHLQPQGVAEGPWHVPWAMHPGLDTSRGWFSAHMPCLLYLPLVAPFSPYFP